MKVAVVWNENRGGVINLFGKPCPEQYAKRQVQQIADALHADGHTVACLEGDKTLLAELQKFMPPDMGNGKPAGMVFNLAYGIQGECRYTHVPAMLEMAGVPYTGSEPLGCALTLDKVIAKILLKEAGVPTPAYQVMNRSDEALGDLRYPLIVKPRHESTSHGLHLVWDRRELRQAVHTVVTQFQQGALVEEYIDGREIAISILGNEQLEFLPPVELDFANRSMRLMTFEDKYRRRTDAPKKICPAPLEADLAERLRDVSAAAFRACHCRDFARVDVRLDAGGQPFVLEINSMASLGENGSFIQSALQAGYSFNSLVNRILDIAHERYFGVPAPRDFRFAGKFNGNGNGAAVM